MTAWWGYSYGSRPLTMQEKRRYRRRLRRQKRAPVRTIASWGTDCPEPGPEKWWLR